jgi:cation transport ATPase
MAAPEPGTSAPLFALRLAPAAPQIAAAPPGIPQGPSLGAAARARFRLEGVLSAACARRIERHLSALPGILGARVDDEEHLMVVYLASRWTVAALAYEAAVAPDIAVTPLDQPAPPEPRWRILPRHVVGRTLMVSIVGLIVGLVDKIGYGLDPELRSIALDLQAVITTALVGWAARPLILGAARGVAGGRLGELALPLLLGSALYVVSLIAFFRGGTPVFEVTLVAIGGAAWLELDGSRLRRRLRERLGGRMASGASHAHLLIGGAVHELPAESVVAGDRVVVREGDVVPTDATVRRGEIELANGAHGPGASVAGGAHVEGGEAVLEARIDQPASSMAQAARRLAATGRADRWLAARAGRAVVLFALASVVFAAGLFIVTWAIEGSPGGIEAGALGTALAILAAAAPVAVARTRGLGLYVALTRAAERGVAFRSPRAVARLGDVSELIFEKTGTVTEGRPHLVATVVDPDVNPERVMRLVRELERGLDHPIARELSRVAVERVGPPARDAALVATRQTIRGYGVVGYLRSGAVVRVGNRELLRSVGIELFDGRCVGGQGVRSGLAAVDSAEAPETVVYLTEGTEVLARFHLEDPVRPDAREQLRRLRAVGVDVTLVTADGAPCARKAAEEAGCARFVGDLTGADAPDFVAARRRESGGLVAAVGDGFEDEELQRAADVGIVIGAGPATDAEVVVAEPDLAALVDAIDAAKEARTRARFALGLIAFYTIAASAAAASVVEAPLWAFAAASLVVSLAIGRLLVAGN